MVRTIESKRKSINRSIAFVTFAFLAFLAFVIALSNDISWVGNSVNYPAYEDSFYVHNFSNNITGTGVNVTFSIQEEGANVVKRNGVTINYSIISDWIYMANPNQGLLIINSTNNTMAGNFILPIKVSWINSSENTSYGSIVEFKFNVSEHNDAPYFLNLSNQNMTWAQGLFDYLIVAGDEENDKPYSFNISFLNCTVAEWSTRDCNTPQGRILFNISNSSQVNFNGSIGFINISFDPERNDVGNYSINFTVIDYNNLFVPYNASYSQVVNFEVVNVNSPPNVTYVCDNERTAQEDSYFSCRINVSDIDEVHNLTISVFNDEDLSNNFFKFNATLTTITQNVNLSTSYNTSFLVNFTTDDTDVGNWTIRFTTIDTSLGQNISYILLYVGNINDSVTLHDKNITGLLYTSSSIVNYYINASDDDLLIDDDQKSETYNETLIYSSNASWFVYNTSIFTQGNNYSAARFSIYPAIAGVGQHYVNVSVGDFNNFSSDSFILFVNITNNTAPEWNTTFSSNTTYYLTEDNSFYINLSAYVNDVDGDTIAFNYTINNLNNTNFISFTSGFNLTTGIINMTLNDFDVGYHNITINALDVGKSSQSPLTFYFYVNNTHDNPYVKYFSCNSGCTPTGNIVNNINITQADSVSIDLAIQDNDFRINATQKQAFYFENLTITMNISGPNRNLFNFSLTGIFNGNESIYGTQFAPNQSDIGFYNITLNITDYSNRSAFIRFNITVSENQEPPIIGQIFNRNLSIYQNYSFDVDSNDSEEINEFLGNLTYTIRNLTSNGNFLTIDNETGIIRNASTLIGRGGTWNFNVTVNDSTGRNDSTQFTLYIFDEPVLLSSFDIFNFVENQSYEFNLSANHSVSSNLTYQIIINGVSRNITTHLGDGSNFLWNFTANFTDETTCIGMVNLTLNISNQFLSFTQDYNLTINHTNHPITFYDPIGVGSPLTLSITNGQNFTMSSYFVDIDANDVCYNQTVGFTANLLSGTAPSVAITNWTNATSGNVRFSAAVDTVANYTITAFEYTNASYAQITRNTTSNNFTVIITTETVVVPTPSSGGSGSSSGRSTVQYRPISLRIIVPDPISSGTKEMIVLPISLENDGTINLNNITLSANVALNGSISDAIVVNLSLTHIANLDINQSVELILIADVNTETEGLYEINIYANVSSPVYSDASKIYINVQEGNSFEEKVIFTEELIVSNPECAEIQELLDDAKVDYENNQLDEAQRKLELAITSCKSAISQKPSPIIKEVLRRFGVSDYILISIAVAFSLGFLYYFYKRFMLSRAVKIDDDL